MSNSKVVIRIGRPTESNKVANVSKKFYTFNGTIVYVSNDINVDRVGSVPPENIVNKRGTICVADFDTAGDILEYIQETFEEQQQLSVVYMIIEVDESINVLYSDPTQPNTWNEGFNFQNVENVIVEDEAPEEVKRSHPLLRRSSASNTPNTSRNMIVVMEERKRRLAASVSDAGGASPTRRVASSPRRGAQMEAAKGSLDNATASPRRGATSTNVENKNEESTKLTIEERELLIFGGFSPSQIEELNRERVDRLVAVLAPQLKVKTTLSV